MAVVNVNLFKSFCEFVSNKVQQGNSTTPDQFDITANAAQMYVFEKDRSVFVETGALSNFLQNFIVDNKTLMVNPLTGAVSYPSDLEHTIATGTYYNSNKYPADLVEATQWRDVLISQLMPPTLRFPKYVQYADHYEFAPKNAGTCFIDYLATPIAPHWGYTVVNDEDVYSPATSVDFAWDLFSMNNVAAVYLNLIGCNLKDSELESFSQMYREQTNSVI